MSQLGLGVMINMLGGNEDTVKAIRTSLGKKIQSISVSDSSVTIELEDNSKLSLWDDGQSCCEHRYMTCDDKDLETYKGATLVKVEIAEAPSVETQYDVHEVQFLNIVTNLGTIQCATHNEHNGYYGGFSIAARLDRQ